MSVDFRVQNPRFQYSKLSRFDVDSLLKIYLDENLPENLLKFCIELLQAKIQSYQKYKNVLLAFFDSGTYIEMKNRLNRNEREFWWAFKQFFHFVVMKQNGGYPEC